jgi:hypothetical protein
MAGRKKGTPKTGGRVAGVPNKVTRELKEMILQALDETGGVEYLKAQSAANPTAFMALIGRVLPLTVHGSGQGGEFIVRWEKGE